ncbi:hypothetical protein ABZ635_16935 [Nocardiopsis sp. NPDC007018]|uniref:hypothetical protein n=1 Tax=Nocardiopsis sp. NPDC007018 TaxID=3155721 RepID=UPI003410166E
MRHTSAESPSSLEFTPPNTDVDTVRLSELCRASWHLALRILGDAGAEHTALTGTAKEFSDLVSEDISSAASYNEQEWRRACMVLTYAAGVARHWLDDVYDFRSERADLIRDYASRLANLESQYPLLSGSDGALSTAVLSQIPRFDAAARNLLHDFDRRGIELKEALVDTARERAAMLDDGPEPHHLRTLVEAGVLGWGRAQHPRCD